MESSGEGVAPHVEDRAMGAEDQSVCCAGSGEVGLDGAQRGGDDDGVAGGVPSGGLVAVLPAPGEVSC